MHYRTGQVKCLIHLLQYQQIEMWSTSHVGFLGCGTRMSLSVSCKTLSTPTHSLNEVQYYCYKQEFTLRGNTDHPSRPYYARPSGGGEGGTLAKWWPRQDMPRQDLDRMYPTPSLPGQDLGKRHPPPSPPGRNHTHEWKHPSYYVHGWGKLSFQNLAKVFHRDD